MYVSGKHTTCNVFMRTGNVQERELKMRMLGWARYLEVHDAGAGIGAPAPLGPAGYERTGYEPFEFKVHTGYGFAFRPRTWGEGARAARQWLQCPARPTTLTPARRACFFPRVYCLGFKGWGLGVGV